MNGSDRDQLQVEYKIKVPSEIFSFEISNDGNHFAMGLNDSSLVIKSKLKDLDEDPLKQDAEAKMMAQFEPKFNKTSKDYKYFNRGQYQVKADQEDLQALKDKRANKLQPYEQALRKFEYKQCLNKALQTKNPEVLVALCEELVERGALYTALGSRSEEELDLLLSFLVWKVADHRYAQVLIEVTRITIDMYSGVFGLSGKIQG